MFADDFLPVYDVSDEVRNGFNAIRVNFKLSGDAPADKLRQIVEQSRARSAVFDLLTNGTSVAIEVET